MYLLPFFLLSPLPSTCVLLRESRESLLVFFNNISFVFFRTDLRVVKLHRPYYSLYIARVDRLLFISCFSIDFSVKSLNFSPTLHISAIRKLKVCRVKHDCRRFQSFAPAGLFSHILVTLIPSFSRKLCLTLAYKETLSTIAFFRYLCCLPSRLQVTTGKWCSSSFFRMSTFFRTELFYLRFCL